MDLLADRAFGEEIQLRVKSLRDGVRFPRGEDVDIHNKMLLLMEIGKARIDTVPQIRITDEGFRRNSVQRLFAGS